MLLSIKELLSNDCLESVMKTMNFCRLTPFKFSKCGLQLEKIYSYIIYVKTATQGLCCNPNGEVDVIEKEPHRLEAAGDCGPSNRWSNLSVESSVPRGSRHKASYLQVEFR